VHKQNTEYLLIYWFITKQNGSIRFNSASPSLELKLQDEWLKFKHLSKNLLFDEFLKDMKAIFCKLIYSNNFFVEQLLDSEKSDECIDFKICVFFLCLCTPKHVGIILQI